MPAIVYNASFNSTYGVSKKAELDSECPYFHESPERRFECNEVEHHRGSIYTTFSSNCRGIFLTNSVKISFKS
jgi:hypothetical protein